MLLCCLPLKGEMFLNAFRYLAKLQNLTKDCESSNHMTDASVQKWIESLPMVEMTRVASVTSGTVAAVESDLSESPPGENNKRLGLACLLWSSMKGYM